MVTGRPGVPFGLFCLDSRETNLRNHQHSSLRVQKQHKLAALSPGPITLRGGRPYDQAANVPKIDTFPHSHPNPGAKFSAI